MVWISIENNDNDIINLSTVKRISKETINQYYYIYFVYKTDINGMDSFNEWIFENETDRDNIFDRLRLTTTSTIFTIS